ncbi:hypothetical protein [Gordonia sp. (in: high G+C Gram-positive bacteria)]|uniref:hypothetical protein n=1 Tax=Gordonia sp. (in: high G+C Gram-positive bacteria) TaxID=84139 RepID=UPI0039E3E6C6
MPNTSDPIEAVLRDCALAEGFIRSTTASEVVIDTTALATGNHPPATANTPVFILSVEQMQAAGLIPLGLTEGVAE